MNSLKELKELLINRALLNPKEVKSFKIKDYEILHNGNVERENQFEIDFIKDKKTYE